MTFIFYVIIHAVVHYGLSASEQKVIVRDDDACSYSNQQEDHPECNWHYIAYFPQELKAGATENVIFSIHGFPNLVNVSVSLQNVANSKSIGHSFKEISPGALVSISIVIPNDISDVRVYIGGNGPFNDAIWKFENTSGIIPVRKKQLSVVIQTDRTIYKAGQEVQGFVVVLDESSKPYSGTLKKVTISNPLGTVMRQWTDVRLEEGVSSFQLITSTKLVLGTWRIKVMVLSHEKELTFEMKDYSLPKFEIEIKTPTYVFDSMEKVSAEICAHRFYGKPIIGNMDAKICQRITYRELDDYSQHEPICSRIYTKIDGCINISHGMQNWINDKSRYPRLVFERQIKYLDRKYVTFDVIVEEDVTGFVENANQIQRDVIKRTINISWESVLIFKPGLPLTIKIFGKFVDGVPVESKEMMATVSCGNVPEYLIKNMNVLIINGTYELNLPAIPFNCHSLHLNGSHGLKNLLLKPWYSQSHSYLRIQKLHQPLSVGEDYEVTIDYTSIDAKAVERNIFYSVTCDGNWETSGSVKTIFDAAVQQRVTTTLLPTTTSSTTTRPPFLNSTVMPGGAIMYFFIRYPKTKKKTYDRPDVPYQYNRGSFKIHPIKIRSIFSRSCRLVVYYVRESEVVSDVAEFKVRKLKNQIELKFQKDHVKPGEKVKVFISGTPNSRVIISAIDESLYDASVAMIPKYDELFYAKKNSQGFSKHCDKGYSSRFIDSNTSFKSIGAVVLSSMNLNVKPCEKKRNVDTGEADSETFYVDAPAMMKPAFKRSDYPETLIWINRTLPENGVTELEFQVPDSITTWYFKLVSISKSTGVNVASPAKLQVFQPFTISMTLPHSVIKGEVVIIPAAVLSHLKDKCISIKVILEYSHHLKMIAGPFAKTCICAMRTSTILFKVRALKMGNSSIRIRAQTSDENLCDSNTIYNIMYDSSLQFSDWLVKKLVIQSPGIEKSRSKSVLICASWKPEDLVQKLNLTVTDKFTPFSLQKRCFVVGDIMGASLHNFDDLLRISYGSGEQNMARFASIVYILNYLNNTNQLTSQKRSKSLDEMRRGFQQQLTYRQQDGSYSFFGIADKEGSIWLTAFVIKSYYRGKSWIDIGSTEIESATNWLLSFQDIIGCFPVLGQVHAAAIESKEKGPVTLTAYVLVSLLEAGIKPNTEIFRKATRCITNSFSRFERDSYSLSIMAYLFAKLKHVSAYLDTMTLLDDLSIKEGGMMYWKGLGPESRQSTNIERSAYVLLAKLEYGSEAEIVDSIPIVRWLVSQRNDLGGWIASQDTVVALEALSRFAMLVYQEPNLQMELKSSTFKYLVTINPQNKLSVQSLKNVMDMRTLDITLSGKGCAIVQATSSYTVKKLTSKPGFKISYSVKTLRKRINHRLKSCLSQNLSICLNYLGEGYSRMTIVDIQMISGFEVNPNSFNKVKESGKGIMDMQVKGKNVVMYMDRINNTVTCFDIQLDQTWDVRRIKSAPIIVYDYYNQERSAAIFYRFTRQHCVGKKMFRWRRF